jgi:hypothetical protein
MAKRSKNKTVAIGEMPALHFLEAPGKARGGGAAHGFGPLDGFGETDAHSIFRTEFQ